MLIFTGWREGSLSLMINKYSIICTGTAGWSAAQTLLTGGLIPSAYKQFSDQAQQTQLQCSRTHKAPWTQGAPVRVQSWAGHLCWDREEPLVNPETIGAAGVN